MICRVFACQPSPCGPSEKISCNCLIFGILRNKNIPRDSRNTRPYLHRVTTSHDPWMNPTGSLKWTSKFSCIFQAVFYSLAPLAMLVIGKVYQGSGDLLELHGPCEANFRGPFLKKSPLWPKMDPVRLISGDPCQKRALQDPFMVQTDQYF